MSSVFYIQTLPDPVTTAHGGTGQADLTNLPLTTPKVTTGIKDSAGNAAIDIAATSSAVNELAVTNSATGAAVAIAPAGSDTDIDLKISAKGAGQIQENSGKYNNIQTYTPGAGGTATLDLSKGNIHHITMPAGNITIALSNGKAGQCFLIRILQDSVGSRTVTWFTTIKWAGGSAPTLTTTASKADSFGFEVTGSNTYDGFVVGQNL